MFGYLTYFGRPYWSMPQVLSINILTVADDSDARICAVYCSQW